jgi:hypothetical protein
MTSAGSAHPAEKTTISWSFKLERSFDPLLAPVLGPVDNGAAPATKRIDTAMADD